MHHVHRISPLRTEAQDLHTNPLAQGHTSRESKDRSRHGQKQLVLLLGHPRHVVQVGSCGSGAGKAGNIFCSQTGLVALGSSSQSLVANLRSSPACIYPRRPLPAAYEEIAIQVRHLTERLAAYSPLPSFSADFLLTLEGNLLFLEGGLGFTRGGLVNPCCFSGEPQPGKIALCYAR